MTSENIQKMAAGVRGSKEWSKQIRSEARMLARTMDTGYMQLAEKLYLIWDTPIDGDPKKAPVFKDWGYANFGAYSEQELGIHFKKAQRLRNIWFKVEVAMKDLDPKIKSRLIALGWSKVRELIRVINVGNAQGWVERAEVMNHPSIIAAVQKEMGKAEAAEIHAELEKKADPLASSMDLQAETAEEAIAEVASLPAFHTNFPEKEDEEDEKFFPKNFAFTAEQAETVNDALARAQELTDSSNKSFNMSLVCLDFLATNTFTSKGDEQKLRMIAKLEKLLGYHFVVADPHTGEIIYGLKSLAKIAAKLKAG